MTRISRPAAVLTSAASLALASVVLAPAAHARLAGDADAPSAAVQRCLDQAASARIRAGKTTDKNFKDAPAVGVVPASPYLGNGSVTIPVVFHVISDHSLDATEQSRWDTMIENQMAVLNASYGGATGGADTPFRFNLVDTTYTQNSAWYTVTPGKVENQMKDALYQGDSETLNVYSANIGDNLLGWAYFPKDYNNGHATRDGVVILDESMPGGGTRRYSEGDTLVHEVGHWLMLEHTFANGCLPRGDGVADTPSEAEPQFVCEERDSCTATPGMDPIHNFMDYVYDACMYEFTPGQAKRMSDAWIAFRAGGNGGKRPKVAKP